MVTLREEIWQRSTWHLDNGGYLVAEPKSPVTIKTLLTRNCYGVMISLRLSPTNRDCKDVRCHEETRCDSVADVEKRKRSHDMFY